MSRYIGYIYKTINLVNSKIYVGLHRVSTDEIDQNYFGSGIYFKHAFEKYGEENFKCEVIEWCTTEEELNDKEKYWIKQLDAVNPELGYNISEGGSGGWGFLDTSGEHNPMYGIHRFGADNPNFGKTWSQESRDKQKQTIAEHGGHYGDKNPMYGRRHTDETKEKLSQIHKGQKSPMKGKTGIMHPCYGLYWWSDGVNPPIKSKECPGPNYHRGRK